MAIPIGGLATGLDTESLIGRLLAIERKPVTLLETRKVKFQTLSAAFKDLNSRISTLKTRADAIKDPATFFGRSVTSSDDTVATATASNGTVRGTFTLTTTALAKGSIAAAGTTKAALTDIVATTTDSFQFKLGATGTTVSVAVDATTTLEQLVKAINDKNAGVKAVAVNTGTTGSPAYKLTLTSNATGAANDIVIVNDATSLAIANTQTATDAGFSITGLGSFTRASNTFSDVLDGVTITLKKPVGSTDLALTYDKSATQSKAQNLVDAYNDVIKSIDAQTVAKTNPDGSLSAGAFGGDAIPRLIRTGLAATAATPTTGAFSRLADVGISFQKDGTLALDPVKFQKALEDDPVAVSDLLAGTSSRDGIADLLSAKADAATKAVTGTIAVRQDGLTASIKTIQKQIDAGLARLETTERALRQRFTSLEESVGRIQRTGNALMAQLAALPGNTSPSNG
jgi:flagellar hook-associated protein 2